MAIYSPHPDLTENDKRLLSLMAKLLLEQLDAPAQGSNLPPGMITLTDKEAEELMMRLEQLVNSREFLEKSYFTESLTQKAERERANAREIYLSARVRFGRSRVLASRQWLEFQMRLGTNTSATWFTPVRPMNHEHFMKMERKLLGAAGLHPRVVELLLKLIDSQRGELEQLRFGQKSLELGSIKRLVITPFKRWWEQSKPLHDRQISTTRIAAAMTVVADMSVMLTTRDWGVAGTLSTMAGATAAASSD